ncbi:MMS19 nucleotide excision repair protein [Microplitis mediator]|uniref:MMS19 nucleotide excision repair protein n=1 Tax=Microplitis mediator TaxID=375433 RepID=UPI002554E0DC|nr:MMS19 nucleotide excision repair protein [Microplitis mediator]
MTPAKTDDFVEKLRVAFDDDNNDSKLNKICTDIAKDIENGKIKLFQVIEQLGGFLTSKDVNIRENGIKSVTIILDKINKNYLNEQEVELLSSFYCDRLKDHHSVIPAVIQGILSIVQMKNLPKTSAPKIFHGLFNDLRCQSELQTTRKNIFLILKRVLSRDLDNLKLMGPDFVYGVISSMDGESDPRNLMILFDTLPIFLREFPLGHLTEEMFEVLACYFPVDFNSAGKDGQEITREDLARGLENCLTQVPEFGEFVLPLAIEKLDSNLKTARSDALNLLIRGLKTYGSEILKKHVDELWPLLRRDLLPGTDQELKLKSYEVIIQATQIFSDDKISLENFISRIVVDLKSSLGDVQLNLYWPSIKILENIAQSHVNACHYILKLIVPLCLGQYGTKTTSSDKIHVIETLNNFLLVSENLGVKISDIPELKWTDIPGLYLNELSTKEIPLKSKLIDGLSMQKSSLSKNQRHLIYEKISQEIDYKSNENLMATCYNTLRTFAKLYPTEILALIDEKLKSSDKDSWKVRKNRLNTLAEISTLSCIGTTTLPILVDIITSDDNDMSLASLNCLYKIVSSDNCDFDVHKFLYERCDVVARLLTITSVFKQNRKIISDILPLIIRKLNVEQQREIISNFVGIVTGILDCNVETLESVATPLMPCNIFFYSEDKFVEVFRKLVDCSIKYKDDKIKMSSCRLISTFVNKMEASPCLERFLNSLRELILEILESDDSDLDCKKSAVILHTWVTKALTASGNRRAQDFIDYQLNILKNNSIGEFAAHQFGFFVDSNDKTLSEDNHCIIKLFYKQRIFQNVIQQNSLFDDSSRRNYLIAFIYLLKEIPEDILLMNLSKLVPLLIECLSLDDKQVILSALKILKLLLDTKNKIFVEEIQNFITTCLKLTTYPDMNVRIAAHDCLYSYCNYSTIDIKPYREDILEKLSETIDDNKRLVRQAAVKARTRWFLVGSPGEPE